MRLLRPVSKKDARYMSRTMELLPAFAFGMKLVKTVVYNEPVPLISESMLMTYDRQVT